LFAFFVKVLLVEVDQKVITFEFKANDVCLLVLIDVLGEHIGALGVCLSPFLGLWVIEL
jgi:hypothetical protein